MEINKLDKSNMRQVIIDSPSQLRTGLSLAKDIKIQGNFKNVIICGMGGSALSADILRSLNKVNNIWVHKDYGLPAQANENSLIICISYSGNTEETLSALNEAIGKKLSIICIASGGKIENIRKTKNIPLVKLPSGIQPRYSIGYIFSAIAEIMENSGLMKPLSSEIKKTADELEKINEALEREGKKLAKKLVDKIPIIYCASASNAISIARIWKIKFNENAKVPAFYNYFPELNHNEMVGFSLIKKDNPFHFIILKDKNDHPRNLKRIDLFSALLRKKGSKTDMIEIKEGSRLFKTFSALLLGDWTSYHLALENGIDPTPVQMVEEFKKLMEK